MKKNSQIHIWLETELKQRLEKQAEENNVSLMDLCRQRLRDNDRLAKIEFMLEDLINKLNRRRENEG